MMKSKLINMYKKTLKHLKIINYYFVIILGIIMISWLFYTKILLVRLPKEIPLLLTEIRFYILLNVCFIYFYIVKSMLFPKEKNIYMKKLTEYFFRPLEIFDTAWKTSYLVQPFYMAIMSNFISYLESTSIYFRHILFLGFQIVPRIILLVVLLIDIFYFHKLLYIYKVILLGLLPLFYRYIKYSLKVYTDHLIIFSRQDYDYILITNIIRLLFGQDINPDAIYDDQKVSLEEYIDIIYENMQHIKNFDLVFYIEIYELPSETKYTDIESNIKYLGGGMMKNKAAINYAKRFFNKTIKDPLFDLTEAESLELHLQFELHYLKIFILKDIIPMNDEIINKPLYKYLRIIIFMIYFIIWSYLLIISYPNIENFNLTELILHWLSFYIENYDPFSQLNINNRYDISSLRLSDEEI